MTDCELCKNFPETFEKFCILESFADLNDDFNCDNYEDNSMVTVKYKILKNGVKPLRKTSGAACSDCFAALDEDMVLTTFESSVCPLGFSIEVPDGYYAEIRPRSGLSSKGVLVQIGTIDSDYRGEVKAIISNISGKPYTIKNGDRIAQIMIKPVLEVEEEIVNQLSVTDRGSNGFGSTGV